jgi:hypothetical protein
MSTLKSGWVDMVKWEDKLINKWAVQVVMIYIYVDCFQFKHVCVAETKWTDRLWVFFWFMDISTELSIQSIFVNSKFSYH